MSTPVADPADPAALDAALSDNLHHFQALQQIMAPTRNEWYGCGSYLMGPESMDYEPSMRPKQALLFNCAATARNVLEVGVHGGHSLLLVLLASPETRITCVDTCAWTHTAKCVEYLQTHFPGRITLIKGDSRAVLPLIQAVYDLVHVDGEHTYQGAKTDMEHALRLSHSKTSFIIDDFAVEGIKAAVMDMADIRVVHASECPWGNCLAVRKDVQTRKISAQAT